MAESTGHIEAKIDALTEKVDDMINEQRQSRTEQARANAELFGRVGANEGDIKALQQTRPTVPQLLTAVFIGSGLVVTIVQLIISSL